MNFQALKGVKDILPAEVRKYTFLEKTAREVFTLYGFQEIKIPVIEKKSLFIRSIGQFTDIVEKEIYSFSDTGGEEIALRPEGTASVVRAYIEHQLYQENNQTKLYYSGPMFRCERPQAGRYRQFYQIGAEIFGIKNPQIDLEVILMLHEFFTRIGLKGLKTELNSVGCEKCRPSHLEAIREFLKPQIGSLCKNCEQRMTRNPLRIFDCKNKDCAEAIEKAPKTIDYLCPDCHDHFHQLLRLLKNQDIDFHLNPKLVRGLDYYTKTAFEITSNNLGAQNAIGGGGRYDNLVREMGGPDKPAIGFALGVERVISLMEEKVNFQDSPGKIFLALLGNQSSEVGIKLTQEIRRLGFIVEKDYESASLKSQLRKANKFQADYVLIIGEDELSKGICALRDMKNSIQEEINLTNIAEVLSRKREK